MDGFFGVRLVKIRRQESVVRIQKNISWIPAPDPDFCSYHLAYAFNYGKIRALT